MRDLPKDLDDFLASQAQALRIKKSGPATKAFLARAIRAAGRSVVIAARDDREAAELKSLLALFDDPEKPESGAITFPPAPPLQPVVSGARSGRDLPYTAMRQSMLFRLDADKGPHIVVLSLDHLIRFDPPLGIFDSNHIELLRGEELSSELVLEQAVGWGYERSMLVSQPGELARRGDVLDVFSPGYDFPVRIEFFGDEIVDLRLFDPLSQRSKATLERAVLIPAAPAVLDPKLVQAAQDRVERLAKEGGIDASMRDAFIRDLGQGGRRIDAALFYENPAARIDRLPKDAVYILPGAGVMNRGPKALEDFEDPFGEDLADFFEANSAKPGLLTVPWKTVRERLDKTKRLVFDDLPGADDASPSLDLVETSFDSFDAFKIELAKAQAGLAEVQDGGGGELDFKRVEQRPWHALVDWLKARRARPGRTLLAFSGERCRKKFLKLMEEEGIGFRLAFGESEREPQALLSSLSRGYTLFWNATAVVSEEVLAPRVARPRGGVDRSFVGLTAHADLSPGDPLVHRDYGVGRFEGLVRLDLGGAANDYLALKFQGDQKLYLPVDRMNLVARWKGPDGAEPTLDRIGGIGWAKTREKARKAIEAVARELVELYATRRAAKSRPYSPTGEMYREFEASFGFEETPDQAKAITEVAADMDSTEPMDRLVCGDVGFGKTEVAMRAAFRAALDGRQTALLCPTTILAEQHYQNFKARLRGFPVETAMLSRFVTRDKQKKVLADAEKGLVDILIGTHRLLSKDVKLPNLSLLVLDEEQRFGVKHKERFKELKKTIDVLTLTATPIPRTLQLSLSGLRKLSVIETPPRERLPVASALIERDEKLLASAIRREIGRDGQVFWVHNRVQGLERVGEFVKKLVPEARIGMAHGQMTETNLEETMHRFWQGELDVLVCTAIIESGLDFPRANTLIVDGAQMFGLGQLYQLRGRVGRSDRQAYAYFIAPPVERLPEDTVKRLKTILDMDWLGAGFQVAMEDLRLRGAGNILGESQSGHIAKVGLDLYLEMLEEAVSSLKGEPVQRDVEPEVSLGFAAGLPEAYVPDPKDRLKYYKGFSSIKDEGAFSDLQEELKDRFGAFPEETKSFFALIALKRTLGRLGVERAELAPGKAKLVFDPESRLVDPAKLAAFVKARGASARLSPPAVLECTLRQAPTLAERLDVLAGELSGLSA